MEENEAAVLLVVHGDNCCFGLVDGPVCFNNMSRQVYVCCDCWQTLTGASVGINKLDIKTPDTWGPLHPAARLRLANRYSNFIKK